MVVEVVVVVFLLVCCGGGDLVVVSVVIWSMSIDYFIIAMGLAGQIQQQNA